MKDLRVFLPVFLLILIVFLLTGCGGFVPSPGATDEDVTTISGQIKMPLICCDTLSETAEGISRETTCDESELWNPTAGAIVELKSAEKGKCNKVIDEATADGTGYYLFEDVQPGLYIITAKCPVEGNEGFLLKDVAEKFSGVALDAGIPDCTSTALALVIEKINNCYNDWYQCFGKLTASKIYNKVEDIADAIGTVDIQAIKTHEDFGNYCEGGDEDLVDLICAWGCCGGPGAGGGGGNNNPPTVATYNLTMAVNPEGSGTATDKTGKSPYKKDAVVDISAVPGEGWEFIGWTVADDTKSLSRAAAGTFTAAGNANTSFTMPDKDVIVTANFEEVDLCEGHSAPENVSLDNLTATAGQVYTGTVTADDDDNDTLTFAFTDDYTPPTGMSINSETGVITWDAPTEDDICYCSQEQALSARQQSKVAVNPYDPCSPIKITVSDQCHSTDEEFCITVQPAPNPAIEVSKIATESTYGEGDTINYTINIENTGDVAITGLVVSDPQATTGPTYNSGDLNNNDILDVDETWTYQATYDVTQDDISTGSFTNTATATGKDPQEQNVTDSDSETIYASQEAPAITLTKTALPTEYSAVGDEITYTYTVVNNGNVILTDIAISESATDFTGTGTLPDPIFDSSTESSPEGTLEPDESATYTATYIVTQEDLDNGSIFNKAEVTGTSEQGDDVTDTDDETIAALQDASILLDKSGNLNSYAAEGEEITYTFIVTNDGNVSISNLELTDIYVSTGPDYVSGDDNTNDILDVGETWNYTATYVITANDLETGSVYNEATATGEDPDGTDVTDIDEEIVELMLTVTGKICQHNGNGYGQATVHFMNTVTGVRYEEIGEQNGLYTIDLPVGCYVLWGDKIKGKGLCASSIGYEPDGNPAQIQDDEGGYICLTVTSESTLSGIDIWVDNRDNHGGRSCPAIPDDHLCNCL
jgi:uncharacterized repeat protein (TIGR01451 family)